MSPFNLSVYVCIVVRTMYVNEQVCMSLAYGGGWTYLGDKVQKEGMANGKVGQTYVVSPRNYHENIHYHE